MAGPFTLPDPLRADANPKTLSIYVTELQVCVNDKKQEIGQVALTFIVQTVGKTMRLDAIEQLKTRVNQLAIDFGFVGGVENVDLLGRPYVNHPKVGGNPATGFPIINDLRQVLENLVLQDLGIPIFVSSNWFETTPTNNQNFGNWDTQIDEPRDKEPIGVTFGNFTTPVISAEDLEIGNFEPAGGDLRAITDKTIILANGRERPINTAHGSVIIPHNNNVNLLRRQTDELFQYRSIGNGSGGILLLKTARDGSTEEEIEVLASGANGASLVAISKTQLCFVGRAGFKNFIGVMDKDGTSLSLTESDAYLNLGNQGFQDPIPGPSLNGINNCQFVLGSAFASDGSSFFGTYNERSSFTIQVGPPPEHDNTIRYTSAIVNITSGTPSAVTTFGPDTFFFHANRSQPCDDVSLRFQGREVQFSHGGIRGDGGFWTQQFDKSVLTSTLGVFEENRRQLFFGGNKVTDLIINQPGGLNLAAIIVNDKDWKDDDIEHNAYSGNIDCKTNWESKSENPVIPKPLAKDLIIKTISRVNEIPVNVPTRFFISGNEPFNAGPPAAVSHVKVTLDHLPGIYRYRIQTSLTGNGTGFGDLVWNRYESKDVVDLDEVLGSTLDESQGYFVRIQGTSAVDGIINGPEVFVPNVL